MDADYNSMFALQQALIEVPIPSADDLPEKPFLDLRKLSGIWISQKVKAAPDRSCTNPVQPVPQKQVDLSRVTVGSQLRHKAFGMRTVKEV